MPVVPFKTPVDYFMQGLKGDPANIDRWHEIYPTLGWEGQDCDLHVYPYTKAVPVMLSMGCPNTCSFCPTAEVHKGKVHYGDYEKIIPNWAGKSVHFMDENFFSHPDIFKIIKLLGRFKIDWLAMATWKDTKEIFNITGEILLWRNGLRCVEMGLESSLYVKVKEPIETKHVEIYYLNMTFLPGETINSVKETSLWMIRNSLRHPIHFNNGLWYAPGQYYYPYGKSEKGIMLQGAYARTVPTFIPDTFLDCNYRIFELEKANYYSQLVYGIKMYPEKHQGTVRDFIGGLQKNAMWFAVGIRCGAIE